jgi:hypothetical protein
VCYGFAHANMSSRRFPFTPRLKSAVLVLLSAALGCTSVEGQCERVCDWQQRCVQGAVSIDDCTQQCVVDDEKRSEACQDAFDEFATCADENQSCPGVDKQCGSEAKRLIEKCDCENPTGPLVELCK